MRLEPFSHLDEKLWRFIVGCALLFLWWLLTLDCRAKPANPLTRTLPSQRLESVSYVLSQRGRRFAQPHLMKPCPWAPHPELRTRFARPYNPEATTQPT
ncbi:hypothetical protein LCGC14_1947630 [marine sediment metagenome]|uniref:Uncharacterized protein n=1 Tax=marine sediment metagenome TaxID=412755 RepID=A0A0F9HWQ2_9ZZZZ